ncbi:unnamed protein product [Acanthoscelides obtectus]|nr:unnamed protein product [Acanthoscelides obtectus]CAK1672635.1 hypothetical protein AOBTE_LOCUS29005 [Acanthoscelides obtectus]
MNYKVVPHRCSIVCPLKLELPSCLGALPLQNTSQSSNKTFPMQQDATTIPVLPNLANLTQYLPHIDPNQLYEQVSNGLSQLFQMFQPSNLQIPSGKSHHAFSKKTQTHENRKRQFLKHTRVLYRNGKRVYEFKELQPFGCYATCEEIKNPGGSQGSQMSGDEDSSEDAYEEGEDAPIEATASPGERPAMKLDGLRPVGPVDFMNMADFGPNGSPAMGDEYYSEKNKVHRKKNRRH